MKNYSYISLGSSNDYVSYLAHQSPSPIEPGRQPDRVPPIEPDQPEPIAPPQPDPNPMPEPGQQPYNPPSVPPFVPPQPGSPKPVIELRH